ncbi:sugar ABC transporter substrate-binding protein [Paenibacillus anseongense]|uniref:ABC transporter substrate-binding protein n=1 Tax=Paenibacillus TaxID=44249 RepID=UPI002DB6D62E|nr:sugar ABC transporter substrate-binding protein [Paenibacillus anseongense]MEC0265333.1 sugar ABC transporter substrate-binding protein [Paenibacillus anseongense]
MKKRGLTSFVWLLAAGMAISGCSNNGTSGTEQKVEGQSKEQVTIKFWHRWPESQQALEQAIKEFSDKYPNIKVELPAIASSQYATQLQAAVASNDLPDIFANANAVPVDQLNRLGLIRDIDDAVQGYKDKFYEGTWTEGFTTLNGKVYALPHFTPRRYAHVLYYNKNVLKNAGLSEKDVPKSWDDLVAVGAKIKQSGSDVYPLILGIKTDWLASGYLGQMATAIKPEVVPNDGFNLKTGQYEFDSPGYVESIEFIKKLQDDKLLHPNSLVIDYREASSLFAGGKAAFVIDGTFLSSELQQNNKFNDFGVAPLPTKDGKPQYYAFQGETKATLHVSKNTKHYEEVKLFLQFYMDRYYTKQLELGVEGSPIVEQNKTVKIDNPPFVEAQKIQDQTFVLSPHPFTRNRAAVQVNTELNGKKPKETVGKILEGYLAGQVKDVKAQLSQLTSGYNKALQESIDKVNKSGTPVQPSDYQFPNWTPLQPYSTDKYNELKK